MFPTASEISLPARMNAAKLGVYLIGRLFADGLIALRAAGLFG
jgi:hypothetical protein